MLVRLGQYWNVAIEYRGQGGGDQYAESIGLSRQPSRVLRNPGWQRCRLPYLRHQHMTKRCLDAHGYDASVRTTLTLDDDPADRAAPR
jgi:hypothetical protein